MISAFQVSYLILLIFSLGLAYFIYFLVIRKKVK